jgi:ubiquinone/menaquinone biosynthesis C-methylase UbiE
MADARDEPVWNHHAQVMKKDDSILSWDNCDLLFLEKWKDTHFESASKVLDFGCGSGLWASLFDGLQYTGCDQNKQMIKAASERLPKHTFILQDSWDKLPFPDESFDVIFTRAVIQHNSEKDKNKLLPELFRVLKTGGHYMCAETTIPDLAPDVVETNGYYMSVKAWENLMNQHRLNLIDFAPPKCFLYIKE